MVLRSLGALLLVLACALPTRADDPARTEGLPPPAALEEVGLPLPTTTTTTASSAGNSTVPNALPTAPGLAGFSNRPTTSTNTGVNPATPADTTSPVTATPAPATAAPVATTTPASKGLTAAVGATAKPAAKPVAKPATKTPAATTNPYANYNPYGGGGGGGGGSRSGGDSMGTGTTLTYPEEPAKGSASNAKASDATKSATGAPAGETTGASSETGLSTPAPTPVRKPRSEPSPAPVKPEPAPVVVKKTKPEVEGRVVLFLRTPGEEDPSHEGVKARIAKEARVVYRLAGSLARGQVPATKPEDGVLRDAAPVGFYLPEEIDAWVVAADGSIFMLETDGPTFETVASFALGAPITVVGPSRDLDPIEGKKPQAVKVQKLIGPARAPAPTSDDPAPPTEAPDDSQPKG